MINPNPLARKLFLSVSVALIIASGSAFSLANSLADELRAPPPPSPGGPKDRIPLKVQRPGAVGIDLRGIRMVGAGLEAETVGRAVQAHDEELRFCFENAIGRAPKGAGEVTGDSTLVLTIAGDGRVTRTEVQHGTIKSEMLPACIEKSALTWTMPRPEGGAAVRAEVPLHFYLSPK